MPVNEIRSSRLVGECKQYFNGPLGWKGPQANYETPKEIARTGLRGHSIAEEFKATCPEINITSKSSSCTEIQWDQLQEALFYIFAAYFVLKLSKACMCCSRFCALSYRCVCKQVDRVLIFPTGAVSHRLSECEAST
jgi:hypothetical protein